MFVGREKEAELINKTLDNKSSAIMLYGKRKVGKTTLIKEVLSRRDDVSVYFECIRGSMQENIELFVQQLVRKQVLPVPLQFSNFIDVFMYLNSLEKHLIVVIDEYPYLKSGTDSKRIDSVFQNIIDNTDDIRLILSGPHVSMMKELLREKNALYGRFQTVIRLLLIM